MIFPSFVSISLPVVMLKTECSTDSIVSSCVNSGTNPTLYFADTMVLRILVMPANLIVLSRSIMFWQTSPNNEEDIFTYSAYVGYHLIFKIRRELCNTMYMSRL
jgi:hypothetical protein